jgi:hypothetical protein
VDAQQFDANEVIPETELLMEDSLESETTDSLSPQKLVKRLSKAAGKDSPTLDKEIKKAYPHMKDFYRKEDNDKPPPYDTSQARLAPSGHYSLGGGRRRIGAGFHREIHHPAPPVSKKAAKKSKKVVKQSKKAKKKAAKKAFKKALKEYKKEAGDSRRRRKDDEGSRRRKGAGAYTSASTGSEGRRRRKDDKAEGRRRRKDDKADEVADKHRSEAVWVSMAGAIPCSGHGGKSGVGTCLGKAQGGDKHGCKWKKAGCCLQCYWTSVAEAKTHCGNWDKCVAFWGKGSQFWARSSTEPAWNTGAWSKYTIYRETTESIPADLNKLAKKIADSK